MTYMQVAIAVILVVKVLSKIRDWPIMHIFNRLYYVLKFLTYYAQYYIYAHVTYKRIVLKI